MKAYISTCPIGSFAFDEEGKLVAFLLFKKSPDVIARKILKLEKGELIEEEEQLKRDVAGKGYKAETAERQDTLQENFRKLALGLKFVKSEEELNGLLVQAGVKAVRSKLGARERGKIIIQITGLLDELTKNLNVYAEKIREWYGLYDPEASKSVKSNESLLRAAASGVKKSDFGMEFAKKDVEAVSEVSKSVLRLAETKKYLEKYLEGLAAKEAPNLTALAGPLVASRLLALAGGLKNLARMPTSKIQLMGAEKALFRHLRDKTRAPKYGVIFAHPLIQQAPRELRGKVARVLASKLSLAAKIDYFSKQDRSRKMKKELETEVKRVLERKK
jgi:nucleolar protein 56